MKRKGTWIIVTLLLLASKLMADPIGPDCETCHGSIYQLESSGNYAILTVDTTGYNGSGSFIDLVGVEVPDPTGASVLSPDWSSEIVDDFIYAHGVAPVGATSTWSFEVPLGLFATSSTTIQVRYIDDVGNQVDLTSENITVQPLDCGPDCGVPGGAPAPTPEPSSLMLIGFGLALLTRRTWKTK